MRIPDFFAPGKSGDGLPRATPPRAPIASLAALPWTAWHPAISTDLTAVRPLAPFPPAPLADVKWSSSAPVLADVEIRVSYVPTVSCYGGSPRWRSRRRTARKSPAPKIAHARRSRSPSGRARGRRVRRAGRRFGARAAPSGSDGDGGPPPAPPLTDVAQFSDEALAIETGVLVDLAAGRLSRDEARSILAVVQDARELLAEVGGAP